MAGSEEVRRIFLECVHSMKRRDVAPQTYMDLRRGTQQTLSFCGMFWNLEEGIFLSEVLVFLAVKSGPQRNHPSANRQRKRGGGERPAEKSSFMNFGKGISGWRLPRPHNLSAHLCILRICVLRSPFDGSRTQGSNGDCAPEIRISIIIAQPHPHLKVAGVLCRSLELYEGHSTWHKLSFRGIRL